MKGSKKFISYFYIILALLLPFTLFSNEIDSLKNELLKAKSNKDEAEILYQLGNAEKKQLLFDNAVNNHLKALNIRISIDDTIGIAKSYNAIGVTYSEMANYDNALLYLTKAYNINKELKLDKSLGITLYNIGNIYLQQSVYDSAFNNFNHAMEIFNKSDFQSGIASCFNTIGIIYEVWEEYDSALIYYQKSLKIETALNNYNGMINCFNNIGNIYSIAGMNQLALSYYQNALTFSEKNNDIENQSNALKNIGLIHTFRADYKTSNNFLIRAVHLAEGINHTELNINVLHAIGYCYTYQGKCDSAIYYLNQSLKMAIEINYNDMISKNHNMLAQSYSCIGDSKQALEHYQKYINLNDEIIKQLSNLKLQLVAEKKEKQIEALRASTELDKAKFQQKITILIAGIILLLFLSVSLFLFTRIFIIKAKHKSSELRHKVLQLQMNPHFIHNSLASIDGHLFLNKPLKTSEYIAEFSHLMRNILESSRYDFVSVKKEVETLNQYLHLQQFRYNNQFEYEINIDNAIDEEFTLIPPMMVQPFVENSIEHGIAHIEEKGFIRIQLSLLPKAIKIIVIDNGVGIEKSAEIEHENNRNHTPLAIKITNERLQILSKQYKNKYNLILKNITVNNEVAGATVEILLPFKTT